MCPILEGQEIQESALPQALCSLRHVRPYKVQNPGNVSFIDFRQNILKYIHSYVFLIFIWHSLLRNVPHQI